MAPHQMTIRVGASLTYRDFAIRSVLAACKLNSPIESTAPSNRLDLKRPFEAEFISAFSEIFNNIVIHGHANMDHSKITINIIVSESRLSLDIEEEGAILLPKNLKMHPLQPLPQSGMGFHIVRQYLDSFEYRSGPPNRWCFSKRFGSKARTQGKLE